jgi:hypothetical protein
MDLILGAILGVLGGSVGAGVIFAWLNRSKAGRSVVDVDELAVELERISKLVRRLTMSNLRRTALDAPEPIPTPESLQPLAPRSMTKSELRQRVFGGQR